MSFFPVAIAEGLESVARLTRRALGGLPKDANGTNEFRLEQGSVSAEMEASESSGVRNRFAPEQPTSMRNEAEVSPTTTDGTVTPNSSEDSSQPTAQDDLKGKEQFYLVREPG